MNTMDIARKMVELCRQGKNLEAGAKNTGHRRLAYFAKPRSSTTRLALPTLRSTPPLARSSISTLVPM